MASKKRVFISFDFDHDEDAKIMLAGQAKLPDSPFDFTDASVKEPLSGDWKDKVRRRMGNVDVVIGLCGEHTHTAKGVATEIEIAQEESVDYFLLAAYSDKTCTKPISAKAPDKVYKWTCHFREGFNVPPFPRNLCTVQPLGRLPAALGLLVRRKICSHRSRRCQFETMLPRFFSSSARGA